MTLRPTIRIAACLTFGLAFLTPITPCTAQDQAQVYWFDSGINRANLDGSAIRTVVPHYGEPFALAFDPVSNKVYWGTWNGPGWIRRSNPDGSGFERFVWTAGPVMGLAIDPASREIYWTEADPVQPRIKRAGLDGSGNQTIISEGLSEPFSIAVDHERGRLYWVDRGTGSILRSDLNGGGIQTIISETDLVGLAVDVSGASLYWSTTDKIVRAGLDGSSTTTVVNQPGVRRIAFDSHHRKLLWLGPNFDAVFYDVTAIYSANHDGTGTETLGVTTCRTVACDDLPSTDIAAGHSSGRVFFTHEYCCVSGGSPDGLRIAYAAMDGGGVARLPSPWPKPIGVAANAKTGEALQFGRRYCGGGCRPITEISTIDGRIVVSYWENESLGSGALLDFLVDPVTSEVVTSTRSGGSSGIICAYDGTPKDENPPYPGHVCDDLVRPSRPATSIALEAGQRRLFWTASDGIYTSLAHSGDETELHSISFGDPTDIAYDGQTQSVYWREGNTMLRMPAGGGAVQTLASGSNVTSMALHPQVPTLYWLDGGRLYKANLDGSGKTPLWAAGVGGTDLHIVGGSPPEPSAPAVPVPTFPQAGATELPNTLTVMWRRSMGASSYDIEIWNDGDDSNPLLSLTTPGVWVEFVSPEVGRRFEWRVRANGPGGASDWSSLQNFTTGPDGPLVAVPTEPRRGSDGVPADSVSFGWEEATDASTYRLQVTDDSLFAGSLTTTGKTIIDIEGLTENRYALSGLEPERTYYWRVAGVDVSSRFTFGTASRFTTAPNAKPQPGAVELISPAEGEEGVPTFAEFVWAVRPDADYYHLQADVDARFRSPVVDDSTLTDSTHALIAPLSYGTRYYWRVRAANESGFGPWSHTLAFTVALGVASETNDPGVSAGLHLTAIYPNPARNAAELAFDVPDGADVRLSIFDIAGRLTSVLHDGFRAAGSHRIRFDAAGLPSGVYLVRLESEADSQTRRLLVVN